MLKQLLLPAFAILLAGCGIDYDGTTKVIFEGYVTDASGQPLEGIDVKTYVSIDTDEDIIGIDKTNHNGYYHMIFPYPKNTKARLWINHERFEPANPTYSITSVNNIDINEDLSDYKINFGATPIFKLADATTLQLMYSGNIDLEIKKIRLSGMVDNNIIDYNYLIDDAYTGAGSLLYSPLNVAKNQIIILDYTLHDGTANTEQITVGNEPVIYTIQ